MASSGILINSTSHSMANRYTFHADSSDSHLFEQSSHAGHVDHENQQIFMTKTASSEHSHYSTSQSMANSGTFHADSSDGHRIKQFFHAGHVDHENQDIFMTKTGTRVRTEGDGVENNAKPYGLKSEQIHDDESGHKPVIIEVENAQSQLRSATMEKPEDQQS